MTSGAVKADRSVLEFEWLFCAVDRPCSTFGIRILDVAVGVLRVVA